MRPSKTRSSPARGSTPRSPTKRTRRRADPDPLDAFDTRAGLALWLTLLHSTAGVSIGFVVGSLTL